MYSYETIPRVYTALAQWLAALLYVHFLAQGRSGGKPWPAAVFLLLWQGLFLHFTENLPLVFWVPCMGISVFSIYLFFHKVLEIKPVEAGYYCVRAFLLAEFCASLQWQLATFFISDYGILYEGGRLYLGWNLLFHLLFLLIVYLTVFFLYFLLEKRFFSDDFILDITLPEMVTALAIGLMLFFFSNLSFVYKNTPFSSELLAEIFNIRTLTDFAGIFILYSYHGRIYEHRRQQELSSIRNMLQLQYDRYKGYQKTMTAIGIQYHDLKHQIAGLRAGISREEKEEWLDRLEEELEGNRQQLETGNPVLDTLLAGKMMGASEMGIHLTCVAEGSLIGFMHVRDICTIFGNALDNAIESLVQRKEEGEKTIHLAISKRKEFVFIRLENPCGSLSEGVQKNLITTKKDREFHGFGLKSIEYTVQKYRGSMQMEVKNGLFCLHILIPLPAKGDESG